MNQLHLTYVSVYLVMRFEMAVNANTENTLPGSAKYASPFLSRRR